ncbi:MAG: YqgE/AlgH family protein [Bacteroidetes bacterium]|nr:YqgE/AlgH family protein [Bacteroidota bacterium]MCP4120517.1 YqgE/AlgH family protein [Bacteroidota bacterium]
MSDVDVKTGKVLLAEPFMQDPNFKRSAILLCEHNQEGSVGFILNKSLNMQVSDLVADFPEIDAEVYFGGPVQTDTIHYIHNAGDLLPESVKIAEGVYWGGSFDNLKFLVKSNLINPEDIRFFIGYSGWSESQLSDEMTYGSWVLANMHPNYLFKSNPSQLWKQIMINKGSAYSVIAEIPDGINWN